MLSGRGRRDREGRRAIRWRGRVQWVDSGRMMLLQGIKGSWCYNESDETVVSERVSCKTY
jgi:hypothetical protein